ncbi:hypothetical protein [Streptomyces sp. ISL-100]|uniref:hypothetical protein n=1 Tax=Streptomyces sp. ISL-100 TaxID=2819173 RepID=UPI001BE94EA4|nr:hypothetical protein [Streptomyces sp. ISL-100]MBT2396305.1 hypothetical protein [Streptomyces sp. ISL-100]
MNLKKIAAAAAAAAALTMGGMAATAAPAFANDDPASVDIKTTDGGAKVGGTVDTGNSPAPSFTPDVEGEYRLQLTVNDDGL